MSCDVRILSVSWRHVRAVAVLALVLTLWGVPAPGLAKSRYTAARTLFEEGNALAARKDHLGALKKYKAAKAIFPSPKIDVNIGTTLRAMGYPAMAATHFAHFLRRVNPKSDRRMEQAVRAILAELMREVASVTLRCEAGAGVTIDSKVEGTTPLSGKVFLSPGTHLLSVTRPGGPRVVRTLWLGKGDHQLVDLSRSRVTGGPPSDAPGTGTSLVPYFAAPTPQRLSGRTTPIYKRWWFWTAVGVVLAGTTAAVVATQTGGDDRLPTGEAGSVLLK